MISFLGWAFLLLILWTVFSSFFQPQLMAIHYGIIVPQTQISGWLLEQAGFDTELDFSKGQYIGRIFIENRAGVLIGSGCSGLELFLIFAGFIIIFKGGIRHKFWFVPMGLALILVLNILRISGLTLINYYAPEYLDFNHKYTFVVVVYGAIFLLWLWWVNRFSSGKSGKHDG